MDRMDRRMEMLKRLMEVSSVVEEMHSAELQRKMAGVREAERAIDAQKKGARLARIAGRSAVAAGDCLGRAEAETLGEAASVRQHSLGVVRQEREMSRMVAQEQYRASRLEREQMTQLVDRLGAQMKIEEERKAQSASDDRFLARRVRPSRRDVRDAEMKAS